MVLGAAIAALILYPLAIMLPVMSLEKFGHHTDASIWSGSVGLLQQGEFAVGGIVLLCSVVLPMTKLFGLIVIVLGTRMREHHRALTYHWIELAGRWGMLDVLLIAVLVAWLKVGDLVSVHASVGAVVFALCVTFSLLASAWFDPHALWESEMPQTSFDGAREREDITA
ncbi:MAG: paraquat-inducible protein A [Planctomycetota bacterium]|jgi:paraquat-inducible protein A